MKIYICSDLHCEFHADAGCGLIVDALPAADVAVVAGDLAVGEGVRAALELLSQKYPQVVYVAGNHEYYNSSLQAVEQTRRSLALQNVHWLENEVAEIDGVRFVGCTLWFGWHREEFEDRISDFRAIAELRKWVHSKNLESLKFLSTHATSDSIVVTHNAPSSRSLEPRRPDAPLNCFYVCAEAEEVLLKQAPRLWIHGHTHRSCDYRLGKTRVISNPFGYSAFDENPSFQTQRLVIKV